MNHAREEWIGIDQKIALLRDPDSYPERTSDVSVIETHKSWVFLADHHAYKLKKPIQHNSVDFRSLEARCSNCEIEVALNRRLAGDVYIGVEQIRQGEQGQLTLGGIGELVDCVVKMKRLPADRMLSRLIADGNVQEYEVRRLAAKLARFYRDSPSVLTNPAEYTDHLTDELQTSFAALESPGLGLDVTRVSRIRDHLERFLEDRGELLADRVNTGRIVDGHGDLRAEHVCLLPDPVMFDCLEFDARLRVVDPVDELAFLSLECERLGDASIGRILTSEYAAITADLVTHSLVSFYKVYRACMWARLAAWRTAELDPERWGKWTERIESLLRLAEENLSGMVDENARGSGS